MDLNAEQTYIIDDNKEIIQMNTKRKCDDDNEGPNNKKANLQTTPATGKETQTKCEDTGTENATLEDTQIPSEDLKQLESDNNLMVPTTSRRSLTKSPEKNRTKTEVPQSPKKRLEIKCDSNKFNKNKQRFIYGNYSQYYGYRNNNTNESGKDKGFHDIRLGVFEEHKEIFKNKQVLDIGCNNGFITMEVAKRLEVKTIVGLDIDKQLISQAVKALIKQKKSLPMDNELKRRHKFPFNATFVHGNYVLKDQVLLEIERPQFDVILCLSITKWIHLNFGDEGLKLAFRRMFLQLKPQGILILEAQPYDNYGRRKKMTVSL